MSEVPPSPEASKAVVSRKAVELYLSVVPDDRHGELFEGLSFGLSTMMERLDWDDFCTITERFGEIIGGRKALQEVGSLVISDPGFTYYVRLYNLVAGPSTLFWASTRFGGPSMFRGLVNSYRQVEPGRVEIQIGLPEGWRECPEFFLLNLGFFRSMPKMLGMGLAVVELSLDGPVGTYTVYMPPSYSIGARIRRAARALLSARRVFEELGNQDRLLQERFTQLREAVSKAEAERALAQAATREAERALAVKSEFLATMSHEIRTPLNGVIGMTDLLAETTLSEEQQAYLATIRSSGQALLTLINDILDFSRFEAAGMAIRTEPLDVIELVDDSLQLIAEQAHLKRLELLVDIGPDVPARLASDPNRLRQLLLNLAFNAIKFTDHGHICVAVRVASEAEEEVRLRFEIEDSGIGIAASDLSGLFQAFSQLDSGSTRAYGGTGLGLAISRRIVTAMNGQIGCDSQLGLGSTFWFEVPCKRVTQEQEDPSTSKAFQRQRVWVVSSSVLIRGVRCRNVAALGHEAVPLVSVPAALEAGLPLPDRIVLDEPIGATDGRERVERVRAHPDLAATPVALVGAWPRTQLLELEAELPGTAVVSRPLRRSELQYFIEEGGASPRSRRFRRRGRLAGVAEPSSVPAAPSLPEPGVRTPAAAPPRPFRALVAEDNPVNMRMLTAMLTRMGCEWTSAVDGKEAVELLSSQPPGTFQLVLMDCHMPVMDGWAAAAEMRLRLGADTPPIVAITADVMPGTRARCLEAGMSLCLDKPLTMDKLQDALDQLRSRR